MFCIFKHVVQTKVSRLEFKEFCQIYLSCNTLILHVLYIVDFLFVLGRVSKSKFLLLPLLYCLHCLLKFLLLLLQFFHCSTPPPLLIPHCLPKFLLLLSYIHCLPKLLFLLYYKELPQKTRLQSIPIAALCLYNIQHENLVFKKSLSTSIVYVSI